MSRKTKNAIGTTIRVLVLVFFFLLVVLPIYWIVITSFKTSGEILDLNNITFFPKDFTLENYTGLFEQFHYGVLLKNSLLVSVASALVVTVFSMLGGYSLARYKFRGKQTVVLFSDHTDDSGNFGHYSVIYHFLEAWDDQYTYRFVYLLCNCEPAVLCHYDAEFL